MRALFIGGTGRISTEITQLCAASGFDITLLNRGNREARLPEGLPVTHWQLDINDAQAVAEKLANETFDVVADFIVFGEEQLERDIALFAGKTKQYIFISSASAYQKPLSHYMISESTPLANPYWAYSRAKIACEERLVTEYRANGFPITIVRPSHTYDESAIPLAIHGKKGPWPIVKRMLDGKKVLLPGDGSTLWTLTHSRDFAKGFIGLMGNIHAIGEAVHITSDESLTWNQIYACIGDALGVEPQLAHVATDFINACDPSFGGALYGDKSNTVAFDTTKLKRLVPGFCATLRFDEGIKYSIENFLANPSLQVDDPDFDRFTDAVLAAQEAALRHFKDNFSG
jgi:nucleoside-diphosphate-sugar epimerase